MRRMMKWGESRQDKYTLEPSLMVADSNTPDISGLTYDRNYQSLNLRVVKERHR